MTFTPPLPPSQNTVPTTNTRRPSVQLLRTQQSAWGLPNTTSSAGRGLTPLSTDLGSSAVDTASRASRSTPSASPFAQSFSSVVNPLSSLSQPRNISTLASPSISGFPPLQAGSLHAHDNTPLLSPRSRAITPASQSGSGSTAAAAAIQLQGGGGNSAGGGLSRSQTFSPAGPSQNVTSPTSATFERSPHIGSSTVSSSVGSSSVTKIVITQLFILLGSITEKEGKVKWDSQAEAIRKVKHVLPETCNPVF